MGFIHTEIFKENKKGGLLIVGFEHGNSKQDQTEAVQVKATGKEVRDKSKSFFSDKSVNDYPIRNRMVKRFELWGYDLKKTEAEATAFERSIAQTNWLETCNHNTTGRNKTNECLANPEDFLKTLRSLQPRLIMLLGHDLMKAFTHEKLSSEITDIFGNKEGIGRRLQDTTSKFRVDSQHYERVQVVSMPHTAAQGISHEAVEAFKPEMKTVIDEWWQAHEQDLNQLN